MENNLITEIKKRGVPSLGAQEGTEEATVYLEMNLLHSHSHWFVTEAQIEADGDILFFGFIAGEFAEWGYFRLSEMEEARCLLLLDEDFQPMPFSEVKKAYDL